MEGLLSTGGFCKQVDLAQGGCATTGLPFPGFRLLGSRYMPKTVIVKRPYYNFCKVSTEAMAILGLSAQLGKVVWT